MVDVSAVSFDSERALVAAAAWLEWGNAAASMAGGLQRVAGQLALETTTSDAYQLMSLAAADLWTAATALQMLTDAVLAGDSTPGGFDPSALLAAAAAGAGCGVSPLGGDLGGIGSAELRSPLTLAADTAEERGRSIVAKALSDAGNAGQIRADEFELVALDVGRYLVVLPGVTDLSRPDRGWSDEHRSVRDLDKSALASWQSTSIDDNRYAQLVRETLLDRVPIGSELVIVGHSFGADTALDLASDPLFNGAAGFNVTHVVAAGYDLEHQGHHPPSATSVLMLNNSNDQVVRGERLASRAWNELEDLLDRSADRARPPANVVVASFDGGDAGRGHHPSNYADYVAVASAPAVVAVLASLGQPTGRSLAPAVAVDLSVPTEKS